MIESAPLLGTLLHAIGAAFAALCYSPQHYLHKWSWQTYWLIQAMGCWLLIPFIYAYFTIPHLWTVLAVAPKEAMLNSYLLGMLYGIGGIAFGQSIRYIGFSLTYAIAIGVSCVMGTLLPQVMAGQIGAVLGSEGGLYIIFGVLLGGGAVFTTGIAGFRKEREGKTEAEGTRYNFHIGLPVVLLAGFLSAVFNFSLEAGQPIAEVAYQYGAGHFKQGVIYLFSHTGAFTTTLLYVIYLATKNKTWKEFRTTPDGKGLVRNYSLALITGMLWYLQFLYYGLGHVRLGAFQFSSWAIHMIILILISCGFGVLIGEWKGCKAQTKIILSLSIFLLLSSVGILTYGNYLGGG